MKPRRPFRLPDPVPILDPEVWEVASIDNLSSAELDPWTTELTKPLARPAKISEFARVSHWLVNAPEDARRTYHTGQLDYDREASPDLNRVAYLLYRASLAGLVELTQARVSPVSCDYLARRTGKPWEPLT